MNQTDIVLLGVKKRVMAISKLDGSTIWTTELPSGMSSGFVTLLADDKHVFAHTHGQLHCLDLQNGRIVWTNELPGCGYGLASLSLVGGPTAPNIAAVQEIFNAEQAAHAGATPPVIS